MHKKILFVLSLLVIGSTLSSCTAIAIVDAAASTAIGVGKGAVKITGAVAGAAIPNGDDEEE